MYKGALTQHRAMSMTTHKHTLWIHWCIHKEEKYWNTCFLWIWPSGLDFLRVYLCVHVLYACLCLHAVYIHPCVFVSGYVPALSYPRGQPKLCPDCSSPLWNSSLIVIVNSSINHNIHTEQKLGLIADLWWACMSCFRQAKSNGTKIPGQNGKN